MNNLRSLVQNEEGVTAIEYALIAALIAVAIIVATQTLGTKVGNTFNAVSSKMP
jgi:pilus assembly protein Flp/PilA